MLQGEDLATIAKRGLREQADFRQAVQNDTRRLYLLERFENAFGSLTELEVGRVQKALLLLVVEQALGRDELKNIDAV